MLIYHALAICVIVKTLSGEMHIQGSHNSKGIDSTIQSQNKQHFIVAVSDSRLAAMSKTIDETKDSEFDCCIMLPPAEKCYLLCLQYE